MSKPKISLNKLGEYLNATPQRRRRIVYDAKHPSNFIVTRYTDVRDAIKQYFISNYESSIIEDSIESHNAKVCTTDFQENDKITSIEALELILDAELPDLSDYVITPYNGANQKVVISGVDVSVNPDLVIRGSHKGKDVVGVIKLHISKNNQLGKEGLQYVTTVLKSFTETNISNKTEVVKSDLCISIDTFGQVYEIAPASFKKRMADITSACEEIALWWDKL